jgi:hypothetical protein
MPIKRKAIHAKPDARTTISRAPIVIATENGHKTVWGYRITEYLAVTPEKPKWGITHLPTGMRISQIQYISVDQAIKAIQKLEELQLPWDQFSTDKPMNDALIGNKKEALLSILNDSTLE